MWLKRCGAGELGKMEEWLGTESTEDGCGPPVAKEFDGAKEWSGTESTKDECGMLFAKGRAGDTNPGASGQSTGHWWLVVEVGREAEILESVSYAKFIVFVMLLVMRMSMASMLSKRLRCSCIAVTCAASLSRIWWS